MTCDEEGCLINTRHPNRAECWREAHKCQDHYWGKERYRSKEKRFRKYDSQQDAHCWKYFYKKFGLDYTIQNKERTYNSRINND